MVFTNYKPTRKSMCITWTVYIMTFFFSTQETQSLGQYRYYNTRETYHVPNKFKSQKAHTQEEIKKAWIKVPWTHGGHYYHNTLTREDVDKLPK